MRKNTQLPSILLLFVLSLRAVLPSIAEERSSYHREEGLPKFEIFEQAQIGTHKNIEAMTFDRLGRLIVGSGDMLSVYDGQTWINIHKSATQADSSLKFISPKTNGQLLAVSDDNIGVIIINSEGDYEIKPIGPQSLSNKLNASNAQGIVIIDDKLYIYSESILSSYDENGFSTQWDPIENLTAVFQFKNDLYVSSKTDGLMRADNEYFDYPKLGAQLTRDMAVVDAIELNESTALIATAQKGLFTYDGESILPFQISSDEALGNRITNICKLGENHIAATIEGEGIAIFDINGKLVQRFDRTIDRRFNQVSNLQASESTLWATLGDAIIRIEYPSSYTYYSQLLDVPMQNVSITRDNGELWISAGHRLFDSELTDKDFHYTPFPNDLESPANSISIKSEFALSSDYGLLVATDRDIILIDNDAPSVIARNIQAKFLLQSNKYPNTIVWANHSEIGLIRRIQNTWQLSPSTIEVPQLNSHLTEDENGTIWAEIDSGRIGKLTIDPNGLDLQMLYQEHGLNEHGIQAWTYGQQVYFSQYDTILRYDEESQIFEEATELTKHLPDNIKKIRRAATDSNLNIWIPTAHKNYILRTDEENGFRLDPNAASKTNPFDIQRFQADLNGIMWAIGNNEVIRIDPKFDLKGYNRWQTHIDKITLSDKQHVLYHSIDGGELKKLKLPYEDNSLVFHFTTPTTSESATIDHQAFLEGFSQNWTHVDQSNVFIIANLHEGDYTLKTRVLLNDEIINQMDAISFSIAPPFYRAPIAYIAYAITFCGVVIFLGTKFSHAAQRENARLQSIVGDRTNELKIINQKLKETAKRAEAANRAKSVFLASMSHEIRTPLNGVIGMTSLLKQTELSKDQRELVGIIENSGENVVNIINDILDYSKIEAGKIELEYSQFSLRETVELAMDLFIEQVSKKNIELAYLIDDDVPSITIGDSSRIRQILVNLIGNAIKFTNSGHIFVHVTQLKRENEKTTIEFTVEDTGIGIPKDKVNLLFQSFSQVNANRDQQYGGTGLGLAISKRLVELMGGDISVESEESRGSQFVFKLSFLIEENLPVLETRDRLRGKRMLIVEDSPLQRRIIEHHAKLWEMDTCSTSSLKETLQLAHSSPLPFDFTLVDMALPEINGNELVGELIDLPPFDNTGFIAISANNNSEAGRYFSLTISKPIKPRFLYNCLSQIIERPSKKGDARHLADNRSGDLEKQAPKNNILLVDDNDTNRKVGRMLLRKLGYPVTEVVNGEEAVDAIKETRFDIVLMDVQMPVMDGKEATKRIRSLNLDYKPWIVAVTAGAMRGDMNKAFEAGMDDFLSKPVLLDTLRKTMERAQTAVANRADMR